MSSYIRDQNHSNFGLLQEGVVFSFLYLLWIARNDEWWQYSHESLMLACIGIGMDIYFIVPFIKKDEHIWWWTWTPMHPLHIHSYSSKQLILNESMGSNHYIKWHLYKILKVTLRFFGKKNGQLRWDKWTNEGLVTRFIGYIFYWYNAVGIVTQPRTYCLIVGIIKDMICCCF